MLKTILVLSIIVGIALGTIIYKYTPDSVKSFKVHKDATDSLINWLNKRKTSMDTYLR
jgi:uncharacterized membrane-anchored protein YhcB (DUF1043 family)